MSWLARGAGAASASSSSTGTNLGAFDWLVLGASVALGVLVASRLTSGGGGASRHAGRLSLADDECGRATTGNRVNRESGAEATEPREMLEQLSWTTPLEISEAAQRARSTSPPQQSILCKLCCLQERDVALMPCGHVVACVDCLRRLAIDAVLPDGTLGANARPFRCPTCRSEVSKIARVYL